MICQVIVNDFDTGRRTDYVLGDDDFANQRSRWHAGDQLLEMLQDKPMFSGRYRWCDLTKQHFDLMIVNMLNIISASEIDEVASPDDPRTRRLIFLFCGLIHILNHVTGGEIETIRVHRLGRNRVLYNLSMTMLAKFEPSAPRGLHLVTH